MKKQGVRFIAGSLSPLVPVPLGAGMWVSLTTIKIYSERVGTFVIPPWVPNNLASIPKIARSIIDVNGPHRIAAIVHDYLYLTKGQVQRPSGEVATLTRKQCDELFYDIMRMPRNVFWQSYNYYMQHAMRNLDLRSSFDSSKPLVGAVTAYSMYRAVRVGGWYAWSRKPEYPHLIPQQPVEEKEDVQEQSETVSTDTTDDNIHRLHSDTDGSKSSE